MKILPTLTKVKEIALAAKYNVVPVSCEILSDFTTPIETMKILKMYPLIAICWNPPRQMKLGDVTLSSDLTQKWRSLALMEK